MRTKRVRSVAIAAVVAAGLALVVSACGGGGGGGIDVTTTGATQGKTFPELKVVWGTTDYIDPGLSYRLESWQMFQDVYLGLVAKRYGTLRRRRRLHEDHPGARAEPAEVEQRRHGPQVHAPQGAEVLERRAGQGERLQEHDHPRLQAELAGDRLLLQHRRQSTPVRRTRRSARRSRGSSSDDNAGTVEIKLKKPQSDFLYILTTFFAAIVPSSTPQKDTENPPPAAAGPYYISQYKPSQSFTVLRNPH